MEENKKTNPLSINGVTDEEFEFYEKLYKFERRAFWKGFIFLFCILAIISFFVFINM